MVGAGELEQIWNLLFCLCRSCVSDPFCHMNSLPEVFLKPHHAGAAIGRHPWVFSGVISKVSSKPKDGEIVKVLKSEDRSFIGYGVWNSLSDIRVRLYSFYIDQTLDVSWLRQKILEAIQFRRDLGILDRSRACRIIFSEADG